MCRYILPAWKRHTERRGARDRFERKNAKNK